MARQLTASEVLKDPNLFGERFADKSWTNWIVFLKSIFREKLTKREREIYRQFTDRRTLPKKPSEAYVIVGRRGGKSLISAFAAVYLACFRDYTQYLAPGEKATIMVLAADRRQTRIIIRYIECLLDEVALLRSLVERKTSESIFLTNGVVIEIQTVSFRSTRGYTLAAAICDEIAFWRDERFANPDAEILNALRPGMATIPGSLLLCISSPYARSGELWRAYRRYFEQEDQNVLIWKATTRHMNRTVAQKLIDDAMKRDSAVARAEYLAEFRTDVESLITLEALEDVIARGRRELPPLKGVLYFGFVDPSGGSHDSFALGIAHRDRQTVVLDVVRERKPPFAPQAVVVEFAQLLRQYRISQVMGDRYAAQWCQQAFYKAGIRYIPSPKLKSEIYLNFLPLLNSGNIELLDQPRLTHQLANLERHTTRLGKETVDHAPGALDDLANAACGAVVLAAQTYERKLTFGGDRDRERRLRAFGRELSYR